MSGRFSDIRKTLLCDMLSWPRRQVKKRTDWRRAEKNFAKKHNLGIYSEWPHMNAIDWYCEARQLVKEYEACLQDQISGSEG